MNKISILLFLLLITGSVLAYSQFWDVEEYVRKEPPFEIKLDVDKIDDTHYDLVIAIELEKESFVVSPFSEDKIYGHFEITLDKTNNFVPQNELLEIPKSVEEFDPILNQKVRFVRQNTIYKRRVEITSKDDFEVSGLIEFVHEPYCVPYDVEFLFSSENGKLKVEKTKTSISKEYKQ